MPLRHIPNTNPQLTYHLIAFDENGNERREPDGSLQSEKVLSAIRDGVTDVFAMSHGWRGDMDGALRQYDAWSTNLMNCKADVQAMGQRRPGFKPLLVGLHWPSEPWGNESLEGQFATLAGASENLDATIESAVSDWATRLGDTPEVRQQLRTILRAAATSDDPEALPPDVEQAYRKLDAALQLGSGNEGNAPGADRPGFDAEATFQAARKDQEGDVMSGSFGLLSWGTLLAPLRTLSFYRMKQRARTFGEGGAHRLLLAMQEAGKAKGARIHLMGHSFGCIVVTGMAAGPENDNSQRKPVQSMVLVQGALSLWAYCENMKHQPGKPGYFYRLLRNRRCEGPIVTTFSEFDRAVGRAYPLAAGLAQQESFAQPDLPKYGGIGSYGIQGVEGNTTGRDMAAATVDYGFKGGHIYNLNAAAYISGNQGEHDAHSDIAHPEVGHTIWQAALPR
jgi:hypothetical protein